MSKEKYHVDRAELVNQLIEELENKALNQMLDMFLQDYPEREREMVLGLLRAANKHGVSTQTMLAIVQEVMSEGKQ